MIKDRIMLDLSAVDQSWREPLSHCLAAVEPEYLESLTDDDDWLPGHANIFNAFKLPLHKTQYILFGESPYPRAQSANGYAFWDNAVGSLWSETGLSKEVNRATSLRNFIKMLLVADHKLTLDDCSQPAIEAVDKTHLIQTARQLFENMLGHGFLLLNASLVLSHKSVTKESKYWLPFMRSLLEQLLQHRPNTKLILWGNIAKKINQLPESAAYQKIESEHPYNISFISNTQMIEFFTPFKLLEKSHD